MARLAMGLLGGLSEWAMVSFSLYFQFIIMGFEKYNIISWNIRGAVNSKSKRHVKELFHKYKPEVFIVLETHTQFNNIKSF